MARRTLRVITTALLTSVIAGCGGHPAPPSPVAAAQRSPTSSATSTSPTWAAVSAPSTPTPADQGSLQSELQARASPDPVALAAVTAWLSWDTRLDHRPNDTAKRLALAWLTPTLRDQVAAHTGQTAPGADWEDWTRHHARAIVTAQLAGDEHPPDTATTAYRQVIATITLKGDHGWAATQRRTLFLALLITDNTWRVDEITTAEVA